MNTPDDKLKTKKVRCRKDNGLTMGIVFGAAFGLIFDNLAIGVALGIVLGLSYDHRANNKKDSTE